MALCSPECVAWISIEVWWTSKSGEINEFLMSYEISKHRRDGSWRLTMMLHLFLEFSPAWIERFHYFLSSEMNSSTWLKVRCSVRKFQSKIFQFPFTAQQASSALLSHITKYSIRRRQQYIDNDCKSNLAINFQSQFPSLLEDYSHVILNGNS